MQSIFPFRQARRLPLLSAALLAAGLLSGARAATYGVGTEVWILDHRTQQQQALSDLPVDALSADATVQPLAATQASAQGWVDVGGVHLLATSNSAVSGGVSLIYSMANARGSFADEFVLLSPTHTAGSAGVARIAFAISGSLSGALHGGGDDLGSGAAASWSASFEFHGRDDGVRWDGWQGRSFDAGGVIETGAAEPGVRIFDVPVVFGDTLRLTISAVVEARSGAQAVLTGPGHAGGEALAAFFNTMAWGGFVSLTDAQGAAVSDFSAVSASSGFDYRQAYLTPVPEPAAASMVGGGLLVLLGMARRRLQGQRSGTTG